MKQFWCCRVTCNTGNTNHVRPIALTRHFGRGLYSKPPCNRCVFKLKMHHCSFSVGVPRTPMGKYTTHPRPPLGWGEKCLLYFPPPSVPLTPRVDFWAFGASILDAKASTASRNSCLVRIIKIKTLHHAIRLPNFAQRKRHFQSKMHYRCNKRFYVFYSGHVFTFFLNFSTFFILKTLSNAKYEYAKIQRKILCKEFLLIIFIYTTMCRDRQTDRPKKNNTINTAVKIPKHEKRPRLMH